MIGGYATGLLAYHFDRTALSGIPAAVILSGAIGLVLARIVMPLRGTYLALTTLSFAEIIRVVISNSIEITRGDLGLNVPTLFENRLVYYYFMLAVLVAVQIGLYALLRGSAGLYLRAIRDDEIAAAGPRREHGALEDLRICAQRGDQRACRRALRSFRPARKPGTRPYIAIRPHHQHGGYRWARTLVGPIGGAFLVYVSSEFLREFGGYQLIVFALLLILFARFLREGLWGLLRLSYEKLSAHAAAIPAK